MPPSLSLHAYRAVATVFHSVALSFTTFRLYRRFKSKNLWWDDHWAFFALLLDLVYFVMAWMKGGSFGDTDIDAAERRVRIALFWIRATIPALVVWSARISICLSIARIDIQHTAVRVRFWVYGLTVVFGLMGGVLLFQKVYVCTRSTAWHYSPNVQCFVGKTIGYISLACDLFADSVLTLISLKFLWRVRMRRSQRRFLSWLFTANIWSSLAGIVYAVMVFRADSFGKSRGLILGLSVHIKVSVTLTVCNLLVVATYIYNRFHSNPEDSDSESEDNPTTRRHSNLPSGRTTKPSVVPQSTILILTDIETNSSGFACGEGTGGTTSTSLTWDGSERGWMARTPPAAFTRPTHHTSASVPEDGLQPSSLSNSASELSLASSLPPGSLAKSA